MNMTSPEAFTWLLQSRQEWFPLPRAAELTGLCKQAVIELADSGELEAHRHNIRGTRRYRRIHRRSLLAYLAKTATYDPDDILDSIRQISATLDNRQLRRLISSLTSIYRDRGPSISIQS